LPKQGNTAVIADKIENEHSGIQYIFFLHDKATRLRPQEINRCDISAVFAVCCREAVTAA